MLIKYSQTFMGIFVLILLLVLGNYFLKTQDMYFRLLIGLGFGYALTRASIGFAGGVNKLARTGSSKLATYLMLMFLLTSIVSAFFLYTNEAAYSLKINPINFALILGGLMFGFGMALASCCATGSLTDISSSFSRAVVAVFFLCFGVFMGFNAQNTSSFVKDSYFSTPIGETSRGGVFIPDLFIFDGFHGYLGAVIFTALLTVVVITLARNYETKYYDENGFGVKEVQENKISENQSIFYILFVKPWDLRVGIVVITLLFALLLSIYEKGWGASSAFGLWFAKLLMLFGWSAESMAMFTHKSIDYFAKPLLMDGTSVQNIGIITGAIIYVLLAGKFKSNFLTSLKVTPKEFSIYAFGAFIMGYGTRLSHGCNVGALYTPIAEFSLSGWLYLIFIVMGGFFGNYVLKNYINRACSV